MPLQEGARRKKNPKAKRKTNRLSAQLRRVEITKRNDCDDEKTSVHAFFLDVSLFMVHKDWTRRINTTAGATRKIKKNGKIAEKTSSARQIKSGTLWFNIFSPRYSNIPFFTPKGEACAPHSPLSLFARVSRPCINFNHGGAHAYFPFPRFLLCEGKADRPYASLGSCVHPGPLFANLVAGAIQIL